MTTEPRSTGRGRPRRAATDAAILRAAIDLVTERGAQGATLTAVAKRAGVARATVYLRWPNRSLLIGAAARAAVGGRPITLTDNITNDLDFAAAYMRQVFADPSFRAVFPEIVRGVLASPPDLSFDSVAPRRLEFGRRYAANAAAQGFTTDVDPHLAFDMLLGAGIVHLLANGRELSEDEAATVVDVLVCGLRRP